MLTVTGLLGVAGGVGFAIDGIVVAGNPTAAASELEGSPAAGLAVASDLLLSTGLVPIGLAALSTAHRVGVDGRVARRHLSHPVPQPIFGGPR